MIIKNASVYTPEHKFERQDIVIRSERIVQDISPLPDEEIIDASGLLALPGLVDIHLHGAVGHDFCDADETSIAKIADFEAKNGILAICPATMTYDENTLCRIMETAAAHKNGFGSDLVGINMEGPFISAQKMGAQNPRYLHAPDINMFYRLQKRANGLIKLLDIAPEESGAMDFIKTASKNVRISLAHTCTDYETAKAAFKNGASHITHLYNAMPPIGHREPGPIVAALEENAHVELIADGIHVHPAMVRFTFNTFGADRVVLISDSMMACGLPNGQYALGGQAVTVKDFRCTLTDSPDTIAGSATCLFDCMRRAVTDMGIPLETAIRAATENPAKCIGVENDYGSLSIGKFGNVVLTDSDLHIRYVIQKGYIISKIV